MPTREHLLEAGPDDDGRRFDRVLFKAFPEMSRTVIFRLIRKGLARLDDKKSTCNQTVHKGDRITIRYSASVEDISVKNNKEKSAAKSATKKSELSNSLEILYQDNNIIALNKPAGVPAHGPGSLEQEVIHIWERTNPTSISFRPGPIHRLDRNTSGIQLFSLSLTGARLFSRFFQEHALKKIYCGIVQGIIERSTVWEDFLLHDKNTRTSLESTRDNGKSAITQVFPVTHAIPIGPAMANGQGYSMVLFMPKTGRTHQIRLQAQIHGHPLSGDKKYGGNQDIQGYLLHAIALSITVKDYPFPDIMAPLPLEDRKMITSIFGNNCIDLLST
ncbi:MAG: RluA family pseudouridine synthase, partial [Spirochaetaceae bacterium]